jgi:hypothetical protein
VRNGASLPFGGGPLARSLDVGWDIQAGMRSLFFNSSMDAAWTADASISNIVNHATMNTPVLVNIPTNFITPVSVNELNRTFANLALGREWYTSGTATCADGSWRSGFDIGGRWGTGRAELHGISHRTDVMTGVFLAVHSDVEMPWGCYLWHAGVRAEWSYTFSHILQSQNDGDVQDLNLMLTVGVRF